MGLHKINTGIFYDNLHNETRIQIPTCRITHAQECGTDLAQGSFLISECFALQFQHFFHGIKRLGLELLKEWQPVSRRMTRQSRMVAGTAKQLG